MKEEAAKIFFRCLATISILKPKVVLLENVMGMLRVWKEVLWMHCVFEPTLKAWKSLKKLEPHGYFIGKANTLYA